MKLVTNAVCMASSTPNSYGLPQAPNSSTTSAAAGNIYYGDYNHIAHAAGKSPSQLIEVGLHQQQPQSQLPQQHVNQVGPFEKRVVYHSSSSLGNYDSYISGMSSDSELTTTTASARHHHHRPYSSQSRVYHAHPVPRNTTAASSRLSHYSSNSAVNAQTIPQSSTYTIRATDQQQQQQQPQQQLINQGALTMTPPSLPMSSISHQNSVASSGSMSSSYLPAMLPVDSPVSPVLVQQAMRQKTGSGRQLPQRPFKQSMSIDHHSLTNQYTGISGQHTTASTHSPAHQSAMGLHRNITGDQLGAYQHQDSYPSISGGHQRFESTTSGQYNESPSQRSIRLEMEMMEKQAANMNLYDAGERSMADLPPTGPIRSSSSTSRHVPTNINPNQGLLEHQQQLHHSAEPYHQHSQDQYSGSSYSQQQKIPSTASTDWLPPMGNTNRPGGQFKQAMSIDHYSAARQQQQHLQRHFSPARQNQFASTDQYHSLGSYMGSSPNHALMSNTPNYEPTSCSQLTSDYYSPGGQDHAMVKYHNQYQAQQHPKPSSSTSSTHHQPVGASSLEQHGVKLYEKSDLVSGSRSSNVQQQHPNGQPNLQHQPSSSSSNSNLSGSLKSSNIENMTNLEKQTSNSEHQKSVSSASTSSHYQQSPQHKMHSSGHYVGRQELLRRGYTSVTAPSTSYVGDFGGSQSALSESGDLSISQTSHSGPSTKRSGLRAASPSMALEASSSAGPHHGHHHHHSASSSHAVRESGGMRSESSTGLPNGSGASSALTKKSNSATQLSMTGTKKRLGFRKKQVTSFSVHRSEEVAPLEARHLVKQGSSVSEGDSSMSGDSSSRSWSNSNFKQQTSEELTSMSFIDGLGRGQMISRQGLASPYLGDIQLSLCDRRGNLEIEIIRARNLQAKTNKILPLTYVKLYLVKNRKCLAKAKTTLSNKRTLNPLFQQQLTFHEDYHGCILQSIVWGNFGKMDKKNFMGIAQISIDDLELSDTVISWYKLFLPSSLQTLPSKSLRHTLLSNSTESFTNTNNS